MVRMMITITMNRRKKIIGGRRRCKSPRENHVRFQYSFVYSSVNDSVQKEQLLESYHALPKGCARLSMAVNNVKPINRFLLPFTSLLRADTSAEIFYPESREPTKVVIATATKSWLDLSVVLFYKLLRLSVYYSVTVYQTSPSVFVSWQVFRSRVTCHWPV